MSTEHERTGGGTDQDPNTAEDPPQRTHDEDHPSTGGE